MEKLIMLLLVGFLLAGCETNTRSESTKKEMPANDVPQAYNGKNIKDTLSKPIIKDPYKNITNLPLITPEYLLQNGAKIASRSRQLDYGNRLDSFTSRYLKIVVTTTPTSFGDVTIKPNSEFLFYSGKIYEANIYFDSKENAIMKTDLTNKFGAGDLDNSMIAWSPTPTQSSAFILHYTSKIDAKTSVMEYGETNTQDRATTFVANIVNNLIESGYDETAPVLPFTRATTFNDVFTLRDGNLWGKEQKTREISITSSAQRVPNGVIWKIMRVYEGSSYSNDVAIYFNNNNYIPINYYDVRGADTSQPFVFNTIQNMNISGAFANIEIGSFPLSHTPLTFVTGYKIKAAPNVRLLVYEYKFSKEQTAYLNSR